MSKSITEYKMESVDKTHWTYETVKNVIFAVQIFFLENVKKSLLIFRMDNENVCNLDVMQFLGVFFPHI